MMSRKEMENMDFLQFLKDQYGYNEPIFVGEIQYKNYSKPWLYKELNRLCAEGALVWFDKGVYYIPTKTILGNSLLDPRKVIEKKYLNGAEGRIGYYSGVAFLNQLGMSTQMPNTVELYTNKESMRVRQVSVGKQKLILRSARTKVTSENVAVLSFLEMMNTVSASFFDERRKKIAEMYIAENNITRKSISEYAPVFPDKAMRTMVESEVIYRVTR